MLTLLAGLGMGLSLIIAIGAQNVFVLRQGLRRRHVLLVVVVCALSDAVLILCGVGGLGRLVASAPWLVEVARWGGAAFLLGYAALAARRALRPVAEGLRVEEPRAAIVSVDSGGAPTPAVDRDPASEADRVVAVDVDVDGASTVSRGGAEREAGVRRAGGGRRRVLATALALTWLNPHVYLDTVFLLGSIASTHRPEHWWFGAGAVLGSIIWFSALGFGARLLSRWLDSPRVWRWIDGVIALIMVFLAFSLVLG